MNASENLVPPPSSSPTGRIPWARIAAVVVLALLPGCAPLCTGPLEPPSEPEPEAGPECINSDGVGASSCERSFDCNAGWGCEKTESADVTAEGCCRQFFCEDDSECESDGRRCDPNTHFCIPMQPCDDVGPGGTCEATDTCTWTADGSVCAPSPAPATCEIVPTRLLFRHGDPVVLAAAVLDENGFPVPNAALTRLESEHIVLDNNTLVADCAEVRCTETVLAGYHASGNEQEVTCTAELTVLGPNLERVIRFFDDQTGADLVGHVTVISSLGKTDFPNASGEVTLPATLDLEAVTFMVPGYDWRTAVQPPSGDLLVPLHASALGGSAIRGTIEFSELGTLGDLKLGVNGVSIHRPLYEMDLIRLFGKEQQTVVNVDGLVSDGIRLFPSATALLIGPTGVFKRDFLAFGEPGRHLTWSLASATRLTLLSSGFFEIDANSKMTESLMALLKTNTGSHSAIGGPLTLTDQAWPDAQEPITDAAAFGASPLADDPSLRPGIFPQWSMGIRLPADGRLTGVSHLLIVVGVQTPLYGFIPLGLTQMTPAGNTRIFFTDAQPDTPGRATVGFAPPHAGLEQSPLSAIVMSFANVADGDATPRHNRIIRDVRVGEETLLGDSWFEASRFGYNIEADVLAPVDASAGDAVDITRLVVAAGDRRWEVLYAGAPPQASSLRALLPDGTEADLVVTEIQSLTLRDDANAFHPLAAPVLLQLDRHVDATYSHLH